MAYVETPRAPFGAISTFRVTQFVANIVEDVKAWNLRRRTYAELSALSPEMLDDIGLTRADLEEQFLIR
ncbi:DUF1127 domain-containing protein [Rhodobacteraceae bacterium NNCM2]|nr:DUF1127 domain-containing protein [Coraliihabitans acroporae]